MRISTKGRYALRLMLDLASHAGDTCVPLKEVSQRQDISVKYLEQIVAALCHTGLVRATRGPKGGYRLARPARSISVGEVLRTAGGSLAPVACLEDTPNQCPRASACQTLGFWQGLEQVIAAYIDAASLDDLICRSADHGGDKHKAKQIM